MCSLEAMALPPSLFSGAFSLISGQDGLMVLYSFCSLPIVISRVSGSIASMLSSHLIGNSLLPEFHFFRIRQRLDEFMSRK